MHGLLPSFFNFFLFVGLLVYFLRKPLRDFVVQRSVNMAELMKKTADQLRSSSEIYNDSVQRLSKIATEVEEIRAEANREAQETRTKILHEAEFLSKSIASDARAASNRLSGDLVNELREKTAAKVLDKAEKLLREKLTGDDQQRISKELTSQLERMA